MGTAAILSSATRKLRGNESGLMHNRHAFTDTGIILICRHGDWNLVPSLRTGVRGGSRRLRRIRGVIVEIGRNPSSMSTLSAMIDREPLAVVEDENPKVRH